jgi:hypothetical protein
VELLQSKSLVAWIQLKLAVDRFEMKQFKH